MTDDTVKNGTDIKGVRHYDVTIAATNAAGAARCSQSQFSW